MSRNSLKTITAGVLSLGLVLPGPLLGQGTTNEDLLETVKRLEARVAELESQIGKKDSTATASTAQPVENAPQPAPVPSGTDGNGNGNGNGNGFLKGLGWEAMVDGYYGYNFNRPANRVNQLRNFDINDNQFSLNLAKFVLQKKAEPFGFRLDLDYGPTADVIHASEPSNLTTLRVIQQAYFTVVAPVGKGLTVDFGEFVTPHGAEVIESRDNFNYSRSLLFALAIPYYHFGFRASYPVKDNFTLNAQLVNGWNNIVDNNSGKTFGFGFSWSPKKKWTWVQNYMAGPEQPNNNTNWRQLFDTTVTYSATDKVTFVGNYDYGLERASPVSFIHWTGVAGYARFQVNKWLALAPRLEWYNDHDGFSTQQRQTIREFTLTTEHKLRDNIITRLEYRHDWSDKDYFTRGPENTLVRSQDTVLLGLIFSVGSPK
jgi:hypothetical protein